jgi:prepilin-type N-terminal cleavage/methylation domain-containing protein
MNAHTSKTRQRRERRRGFTAAELAAVAAIIAILSLIIVPIFRDRVDEAKRVATQDDLQGLAKALLLVKADTGRFVRLNDLDNPRLIAPGGGPQQNPQEVPFSTTQGQLANIGARDAFGRQWEGPYAAFQNSISFAELVTIPFVTTLAPDFGPIVVYDTGGGNLLAPNAVNPNPPNSADYEDDRYPTDPYGGPYIFRPPVEDLPPGKLATYGVNNESNFGNAFIYSLGPNGIPGDGGGDLSSPDAGQNPLYEESGVIGNRNTDDLKYVF